MVSSSITINIPLLISGYWQIQNLVQNANDLLRKIKDACILLAHHPVNLSSAGNFASLKFFLLLFIFIYFNFLLLFILNFVT